jgi:hypothetical protein
LLSDLPQVSQLLIYFQALRKKHGTFTSDRLLQRVLDAPKQIRRTHSTRTWASFRLHWGSQVEDDPAGHFGVNGILIRAIARDIALHLPQPMPQGPSPCLSWNVRAGSRVHHPEWELRSVSYFGGIAISSIPSCSPTYTLESEQLFLNFEKKLVSYRMLAACR